MTKKDFELLEIIAICLEKETRFSSGIEADHPYFKKIIAWGKDNPQEIIPWIVARLHRNWHWTCALWEIVEKEKAPYLQDEDAGHSDKIKTLWIKWLKSNIGNF